MIKASEFERYSFDDTQKQYIHVNTAIDLLVYLRELKDIDYPLNSLILMHSYAKGKNVYAWHISDLKIYDKPLELSEFCVLKKCNSCKNSELSK